jgi:glycosyltransferase involved in cell wall biosynthesis
MISVVVPAYDEEDCLGACLATLASQTAEHEVIVVDDGSTDATCEVAEAHGARLLRQAHRGPAVARNLGASVAAGEILAFLDADMTFAPDFLEKLVAPIVAGDAVGTFTRDELLANGDKRWARFVNVASGLPPDRRMPADFGDEGPVFRAIRRDAFERAGGYDDVGTGEDVTISRKLGVLARRAEGAVCWHRNPHTAREIFSSARWYGKSDVRDRGPHEYVRMLPPISVARALKAGARHRSLSYAGFQLVRDTGHLAGLLSHDLFHSHHAR